MKPEKVYAMDFGRVYACLVQKAQRKGRTKEEVDALIQWLLGYAPADTAAAIARGADVGTFYGEAPRWNPKADDIHGSICGVRIEEIEDPLMRRIRCLDKQVDELAKGKPLEKILNRKMSAKG